MKNQFFYLIILFFVTACSQQNNFKKIILKKNSEKNTIASADAKPINDAALILSKKQVPVLCFHHIREPKPGESETMKSYSVSPPQFAELMKTLKDSSYQTILPGDLYNYLAHNGSLPAKPVMLTFDDTDEEQFSIAYPEMKKYNFKGVFFIMTVSINRPRYMTKEQLKQLSDDGNAVESHTWDHHMVTKYQGNDWNIQFIKPRKTIEDITGKPADYFAYPYGLWNEAAIPELKKAGFKMAFILSTKRDSIEPLYTVRRMIVPGTWSIAGLMKAMRETFHL